MLMLKDRKDVVCLCCGTCGSIQTTGVTKIMPPKQSREVRLEKKRLAERRRLERIKNDPVLRAQLQEKERKKYLEKKRIGKIIPVSDMTPKQVRIMRKKSRESSKRYNDKKKREKLQEFEEIVICTNDNDFEAESIISILSSAPQSPIGSQHSVSPSPMSPLSNAELSNPASPSNLIHFRSYVTSHPTSSPFSDACTALTSSRITRSSRKQIIDTVIDCPHNSSDFSDLDDTATVSTALPSCSPYASSVEFTPHTLPAAIDANHLNPKSTKKKPAWKYLVRKMKYRADKELQIKERSIQELKMLNEKYRKQLQRLRKTKTGILKSAENQKETQGKENKLQSQIIREAKSKMKNDIFAFFEEDENSRQCPGKKEYITRNKDRKQKRHLKFTLHQLHENFLKQHPEYKISYSFFCKFRPFWIVTPNVNARDTC